jgi:signal transduction histidine kinase
MKKMVKTHKILCIEDDPVNAKLVKVKLGKKYGYENILLASNGQEGIEIFKKEKPSVVLLDIMMPGMDGYEVIESLESLFKEMDEYVPVIFLTAKAGRDDEITGFSKGASAYITKPFDTEMLIAVVDSKIKIKVLQDEIKNMQKRYQAVIAHDIRSPAGAVDMTVQSLLLRLNKIFDIDNIKTMDKNDITSVRGKIEKSLNNIRVLTRHQLSLVDNILDFTKLTDGSIALQGQRIKFSDIVSSAVQILSILSENKKISIILENESEMMIKLDELAVYQILNNLIGNAIKFTQPEGTIQIKTEDVNGHVRLTVSDNGKGIDDEMMGRLFKPFSSGNIAGSKTGLGLYITKNLVESHKGSIKVESKVGEGSTFVVELYSLDSVNNTVKVPS